MSWMLNVSQTSITDSWMFDFYFFFRRLWKIKCVCIPHWILNLKNRKIHLFGWISALKFPLVKKTSLEPYVKNRWKIHLGWKYACNVTEFFFLRAILYFLLAMSKILSFHYLIPGTLLTSEQETMSLELDNF